MKKFTISCFALLIFAPSVSMAMRINLENLSELRKFCHCKTCNYKGADLSNINLNNPDQYDCPDKNRFDCNLVGNDFSNANMTNSLFINNDAGNYDSCIRSLSFSKVNFSRANLSGSEFNQVDFPSANFTLANLENTKFIYGDFENANFTRAKMKGVSFNMRVMQGFSASFEHANFSYAHLEQATIEGWLKNANFSHAHFDNTKLLSSGGERTPINGINAWHGTNFSYTDLSKVIFDENETSKNKDHFLQGAIFCHTIMPDHSINNRDCKKTNVRSNKNSN